jgi:hypothetical protein
MHSVTLKEYRERYPDAPLTLRKKEEDILTTENAIACMICGKLTRAISEAHLQNIHGISMSQYRAEFPDAKLVNNQTRDKISKKKTGISRGEEFCKRLSEQRKGTQPKHLVGIMSAETALKIARTRLKNVSDDDFTILNDKDKLAEKLSGQSMSLLAEEMGVSISLISKQCKKMGIKL